MKSSKRIEMGRMLAAIVLVGSTVYAQQVKVEDQDLLNMLESVNNASSDTQEVTVADSLDTLDVATSNSPGEISEANTNEMVDALSVEILDESEASTIGNLITVRLNKVSLEDAINLFAQLSGANIIVPELTEASMISVNLKDVEWRPALQSILDTYNYELYQRVSGSNVYAVRRRPPGAPEPQVVETFKLEYATVPNAAALIRGLLPADAKISEFASRNMMVIKSTESSLSEVRAVLETIDQVRQQVYIESKFMELTDDAQKDLGIDWSVLQAYGLGAQNLGYNRTQNDSDSRSTARYYDNAGNLLESAGAPQFVEDASGVFPTERYQEITPSLEKLTSKSVTEVSTAVLSADDFRVVMSALEQNKGVNIVSNPKIIVANEELANISIIRKEPNLKQEREQQLNDQPSTTTYTLDTEMPFFEYGIKLDVTPSINTSSNITVQIQPSLTRKYADKIAGDNTYPIIDEKSIDTVFNLASGQTAAIGGLTEITEGEEERKVPLLGSIPFIGRLFSWKQTVTGQDETVIFVTVGLANTEQLEAGNIDMPGDAELARRQLILDNNKRVYRDHGRGYFELQEEEKLESMMKVLDQKEAERQLRRQMELEKEAQRKERAAQKEAERKEREAETVIRNR
ncbi:hypothetical protein P4B35_12860 [Pontiellaceae bacterium B12227]|nr:hypothetical protein [Pontiellaceae bacterium B12227]